MIAASVLMGLVLLGGGLLIRLDQEGGLFAHRALLFRGSPSGGHPRGGPSDLFVALVYILAANLTLFFLGTPLAVLLWGTLSGLALGGWLAWHFAVRYFFTPAQLALWGASLLLIGAYLFFVPLSDVDGRVLWVFPGKMAFYHGRFAYEAGFSAVTPHWILHADYPKLPGALAGQIAEGFGYWNEYLPKNGLIILLGIGALGFAAFPARVTIGFVWLVVLMFSLYRTSLFNGGMDGCLMLFSTVALLYLTRFLEKGEASDLTIVLAALAVTAMLKNEGLMINLVAGSLLLVFKGKQVAGIVWSRRFLPLFPYLPVVLWGWLKFRWGLTNDLDISIRSLARIAARDDGDILLVVRFLFEHDLAWQVPLVSLFLGWMFFSGRKIRLVTLFPIVFSVVYLGGLCLIFLATPNDLEWQLRTAAKRTFLVSSAGLLTGLYFLALKIREGGGLVRKMR